MSNYHIIYVKRKQFKRAAWGCGHGPVGARRSVLNLQLPVPPEPLPSHPEGVEMPQPTSPPAQGAILETRDRIPRRAPGAWSLLLPLPVSLPLSLSLSVTIINK